MVRSPHWDRSVAPRMTRLWLELIVNQRINSLATERPFGHWLDWRRLSERWLTVGRWPLTEWRRLSEWLGFGRWCGLWWTVVELRSTLVGSGQHMNRVVTKTTGDCSLKHRYEWSQCWTQCWSSAGVESVLSSQCSAVVNCQWCASHASAHWLTLSLLTSAHSQHRTGSQMWANLRWEPFRAVERNAGNH